MRKKYKKSLQTDFLRDSQFECGNIFLKWLFYFFTLELREFRMGIIKL